MDEKILGMGNALTDVCVSVSDATLDSLDLPKGSMQLVDEARSRSLLSRLDAARMCAGGCASNTICGLGKLGLPVALIGKIGRDAIGEAFEQNLRDHGVEPRLVRSGSPSGTAIALVTPDSERTFATFLGAAVELSAGDLDAQSFADAGWFHIEGYLVQNHDLFRAAVQHARDARARISIDLASYNVVEENLDFLREIASGGVYILFANEEEAHVFTGEEDEQRALSALAERAEIAVLKLGRRGSLLARGAERARIPVEPVEAVDTTGAGDLYAAGFLYGLVQGAPLETCGRFGAHVAAEIIQTLGAHMDDASWARIHAAYPG
ncbi:MAG: adenosine kinase [Deltaproteobacteria bacterium]|nr:adenosine kinase [Deltaproteobacteria bacterium]